jgi:glutathione S-transferase
MTGEETMTTPKIYGTTGSRAIRSIWMAEELAAELGFDYELVQTHFATETKNSTYREINPNGRVPALVDGDLRLFESMAINLYLAKQHPESTLAPRDAAEEALATQWSIWALTEMEDALITVIARHPNIALFPPDPEREAEALATLERPLKVLDRHLADREFLVADRFMIADLNVAAQMALMNFVQFDLSPYPNVQEWVTRAWARPALAAAQGK